LPVPPPSGPQPRNTDPVPLRPRLAPARPAPEARPLAKPGRPDRVQLSDLGRELAEAELRTGDDAEPRIDLIARLRSEVLDGTYRTDARALARAMLERGDRA
jgi:anti-sigma28 factor (negative regulator of flagellin synthesis)